MKTLIRHLACDTPIFVVDGKLEAGVEIRAQQWRPLDNSWPQPQPGERMVCPNCGKPFSPNDRDLDRVFVDDDEWPTA